MLNNYLIYFYQPSKESGIPNLIPQGRIVLGILTIIGLIKAIGHIIDAVTDPLIASCSDKSRHPDGRRIPLMKKAAIPFGLCALLMTLFTANGLLVGDTRMALRGIGAQPHCYVSMAYQDWLITQRTSAPARDTRASICWLMDIPALYRCRAPGNTCLSALTQQQGQPPPRRRLGRGGDARHRHLLRPAARGRFFRRHHRRRQSLRRQRLDRRRHGKHPRCTARL